LRRLFFESRRAGLGGGFLDAIDESVALILTDPPRLPLVEGEVRRQFVRRFPYEIYFRASSDEVRILAVKHHRREPDYWKSRR
jgi:plasmid stabilization system protein ParE